MVSKIDIDHMSTLGHDSLLSSCYISKCGIPNLLWVILNSCSGLHEDGHDYFLLE